MLVSGNLSSHTAKLLMAIILKLYIKTGALFHRPVKNDVEKMNQPSNSQTRAPASR